VKAILLAALVLGGCGVHVSDGTTTQNSGGSNSNGEGGSNSNGGGGDLQPDAPTETILSDAPDATCRSNTVYLAFDGVTLKSTQARSDATLNAAYWAGRTQTVPPYHQNDANRATEIAAITAAVKTGLALYPISVVTTRPAAGPYIMIAFGGRSTVNFNFNTEYYAIQTQDCDNTWPSDVGWVSDIVEDSQLAADNALGAIGWGLGLSGTTDPSTCMCGWGSSCDSADVPCTFGTHSVADTCNGGTITQDENAAIHKTFCE
jgi:hypothetical protein